MKAEFVVPDTSDAEKILTSQAAPPAAYERPLSRLPVLRRLFL